jgi:hypothetical protein
MLPSPQQIADYAEGLLPFCSQQSIAETGFSKKEQNNQ